MSIILLRTRIVPALRRTPIVPDPVLRRTIILLVISPVFPLRPIAFIATVIPNFQIQIFKLPQFIVVYILSFMSKKVPQDS